VYIISSVALVAAASGTLDEVDGLVEFEPEESP
jgi:hypothetical protein